MTGICLSFLLVLLVACSPRLPVPEIDGAAVELDTVPFYPQEQYQCGPAALATVLNWSEVAVSPDLLAPALMIPARKGSLQIELQAQTRVQGRVPFTIRGDISSLLAELRAGHPVLVLQNLAFDWKPMWHYAVVVGMNPVEHSMILRSGRERRHQVSVETFEKTWARAGHWGLVILKPGELPASADAAQVLAAVAPFEQASRWEVSAAVYQSALTRWPRQSVFGLGLANSQYAQGNLLAAAATYRNMIGAFPSDPAAYNNLALVLADLKRWDEAERLVARALELGGPLREEFLDTQRQIKQRIREDNRAH